MVKIGGSHSSSWVSPILESVWKQSSKMSTDIQRLTLDPRCPCAAIYCIAGPELPPFIHLTCCSMSTTLPDMGDPFSDVDRRVRLHRIIEASLGYGIPVDDTYEESVLNRSVSLPD